MKRLFNFIKAIKGFWKLYNDYEYDGETIEFIIENYEKVLDSRTKTMSKPTYYANDVISELDEWYEERRNV